MKPLLSFLLLRLPGRLRTVVFRKWLGWEIDPSARVGLSWIDADFVEMGPYSQIGHFTVIRDLTHLTLGEGSSIKQWNWITSSRYLVSDGGPYAGALIVGVQTSITSRHYLDCSGGIVLGDYSLLAGIRSTILTHQIDVKKTCQTLKPVRIGSHCLVSSNVKIAPGSVIADEILIGMGAVVAGELSLPRTLYGGVPARPIKSIESGTFFTNKSAWIGLEKSNEEPIREQFLTP